MTEAEISNEIKRRRTFAIIFAPGRPKWRISWHGLRGDGSADKSSPSTAYRDAEAFTTALKRRTNAAGCYEDATAPAHLLELRVRGKRQLEECCAATSLEDTIYLVAFRIRRRRVDGNRVDRNRGGLMRAG